MRHLQTSGGAPSGLSNKHPGHPGASVLSPGGRLPGAHLAGLGSCAPPRGLPGLCRARSAATTAAAVSSPGPDPGSKHRVCTVPLSGNQMDSTVQVHPAPRNPVKSPKPLKLQGCIPPAGPPVPAPWAPSCPWAPRARHGPSRLCPSAGSPAPHRVHGVPPPAASMLWTPRPRPPRRSRHRSLHTRGDPTHSPMHSAHTTGGGARL